MSNIKTSEELISAIKKNNEAGGKSICVEPYITLNIKEVIHITKPISINGNSATIIGEGNVIFEVNSSDVLIENVNFENIKSGVAVDGAGSKIENITITHCKFSKFCGYSVNVVSTVSESGIKNVKITHNNFVGKDGHEAETLNGFTTCINIGACVARTSESVDNCITEDILIEKNRSEKGHRVTVNMCTSSCDYNGDVTKAGYRKNPIMRNIKIFDNDFDGAWDAIVNVIGGLMRQQGGMCSGIEIAHNRILYGIWGIGGTAVEPLFGTLENCIVKDVNIHDNLIVADPQGAGEKQHAIAFCAGRIDYFHNTKCINGGFENLTVKNNTITATDRGILIAATDGLLDGRDSEIGGCYVKNVNITGNKFKGVIDAFTFVAGYIEGRLFDWNIGIPRRNKHWSDLYEDNNIISCNCHDNYIDGIVCEDNEIDGNRYKFRIYGTLAHGHALLTNNKVKNVQVKNNIFKNTEGHIHVANAQYDGWCRDGGGNEVDLGLKDIL